MAKVFLGGTVNGSQWRNYVMPKLKITYFNPVVDDWNEQAYQRELQERENCEFCLYVITPKMEGAYSIAEAVDDSNKRPRKTLFCVIQEDEGTTFTPHQLKAMKAIGKMIQKNGSKIFESLEEIIHFLNK